MGTISGSIPASQFVHPSAASGTLYPEYYGGGHAAANMQADLTRAQWNDYLNRFGGIEQELVNGVVDDTRLNAMVGEVGSNIGKQTAISEGGFNRNMGRYGIQMTAAQRSAHDAQANLSNAAMEAGLKNMTRRQAADSNMQLLSGVGTLREDINNAGNP